MTSAMTDAMTDAMTGAKSRFRGFFVVEGVLQRVRVASVAVVVVALVAGGFLAWRKTHELPSDAAFKYGDTVVSIKKLDQRIHVLGALYGVRQPTDSDKQDKFRRSAAQAYAMTLILDKAASDDGVVISDKSARDTLEQMLASELGDNPQRSFDALLTKYGVDEGDVLLEIKRQQAIATLFRKVTRDASAKPSSAAVASYFKQHATDFGVPARRHLLNIVVKTRADAATVLKATRTEDFRALARKYSLDDSTRSRGGDLGNVSKDQLADAYAKAAFSAHPGSAFGPVRTAHGWNVGIVVSSTAARPAVLAKVRSRVSANLRSERALDAWRKWLADKVADAHIQYADDYRPADPDALPAIQGLPTTAAGGAAQ